jgi:hypothetical protein
MQRFLVLAMFIVLFSWAVSAQIQVHRWQEIAALWKDTAQQQENPQAPRHGVYYDASGQAFARWLPEKRSMAACWSPGFKGSTWWPARADGKCYDEDAPK